MISRLRSGAPQWAPVATGALLACGFPAIGLYPIEWVALVPLFWRCMSARPAECAPRFFVAGCVFHALLLQWLLGNIHWAGGWAIWGYAIVCVVLSLYWALFGAVWGGLRRWLRPVPLAFSSALMWGAMEIVGNILLTGFGWGALGYAQAPNLWVLQLAAVGGVTLLSMIVVAVNVLLAQAIADRERRVSRLAAAAAVLAAGHGLGALMLGGADFNSDPLSVGLLQSDFSQGTKWDDEFSVAMVEKSVDRSLQLAGETPLDLMVWPEGAVMDEPMDPSIAHLIEGFLTRTNVPLLVGGARLPPGERRWANSAFLLTPNGSDPEPYDKIHLAPFGEYMPLRDYLPLIDRLVPAIGDMVAGKTPAVYEVTSRQSGRARRVAPLICFEVLFPAMSERLRLDGADVLAVMTNLAWFGASNIVPQELQICRMRAVETRLPVIHVGNTGYTGVADPWGRFYPIGPPHVRLAGAVRVPAPGRPPVPGAPRWVDAATLAVAGALLAAMGAQALRGRGPSAPSVEVQDARRA